MIIKNVFRISGRNVARHCWRRLAQYQNTEQTAGTIIGLHELQRGQFANAKRQATEIKRCLSQAKEYYDAASSVSLATQPVLLYYAIMSMALAEILLKQSAESRLEKLRAEHGCHGLDLTVRGRVDVSQPFQDISECLVARAQVGPNGPRGTFEVWRRSHREHPITGVLRTQFPNSSYTDSFRILLEAEDIPPPTLPRRGVSLSDCVAPLPYMSEALGLQRARIDTVRAVVRAHEHFETRESITSIIVQPTEDFLLERLSNRVICSPGSVNQLEFRELHKGFAVDISNKLGGERITWPHSMCMTDKLVHFNCGDVQLGEFGLLYIALHICGNFARYYPDLWLSHIEHNSPLALTIEELCGNAFERLPLLLLSELSRCYHVLDS